MIKQLLPFFVISISCLSAMDLQNPQYAAPASPLVKQIIKTIYQDHSVQQDAQGLHFYVSDHEQMAPEEDFEPIGPNKGKTHPSGKIMVCLGQNNSAILSPCLEKLITSRSTIEYCKGEWKLKEATDVTIFYLLRVLGQYKQSFSPLAPADPYAPDKFAISSLHTDELILMEKSFRAYPETFQQEIPRTRLGLMSQELAKRLS